MATKTSFECAGKNNPWEIGFEGLSAWDKELAPGSVVNYFGNGELIFKVDKVCRFSFAVNTRLLKEVEVRSLADRITQLDPLGVQTLISHLSLQSKEPVTEDRLSQWITEATQVTSTIVASNQKALNTLRSSLEELPRSVSRHINAIRAFITEGERWEKFQMTIDTEMSDCEALSQAQQGFVDYPSIAQAFSHAIAVDHHPYHDRVLQAIKKEKKCNLESIKETLFLSFGKFLGKKVFSLSELFDDTRYQLSDFLLNKAGYHNYSDPKKRVAAEIRHGLYCANEGLDQFMKSLQAPIDSSLKRVAADLHKQTVEQLRTFSLDAAPMPAAPAAAAPEPALPVAAVALEPLPVEEPTLRLRKNTRPTSPAHADEVKESDWEFVNQG